MPSFGKKPRAAVVAYQCKHRLTGAFLYLPGLRYFCADTPAFADEVNANTQGLVSAVEQKVGRLGESAMSCGDNNVVPTLKHIR
jgi:hypothetical protein